MATAWLRKLKPADWLLTAVTLLLAAHSLYWLIAIAHAPHGWDFHIYTTALHQATHHLSPYHPYHIGRGFLNHPAALLLIAPFQNNLPLWHLLTLLAYFITIVLLATNRWPSTIHHPPPTTYHPPTSPCSIQSDKHRHSQLIILLLSAPLIEAFYIGQLTPLTLLALTLTYLWHDKRPYTAGLTLTLAIITKTSPAILLLYFLTERRWRTLLSTILSLLFFSLLTSYIFYPTILWDYAHTLTQISGDWHPVSSNFALSALLHRVSGGHPAVLTAWRGLFILGILFSIRNKLPSERRFASLLAVIVIFSPLVWYHHFLLLILPTLILPTQLPRHSTALSLTLLLLLQSERLIQTAWPIWPLASLLVQGILLLLIFSTVSQRFSTPLGNILKQAGVLINPNSKISQSDES